MAKDRKTGRGKPRRGKPGTGEAGPSDTETDDNGPNDTSPRGTGQEGAGQGKTIRTKSGIVIEEMGELELSPQEDHDIQDMIDQSERDIDEVRINFRWGYEQLSVVKRVARKLGIPYQTYMKMVVYRQAVEDLKSFQ